MPQSLKKINGKIFGIGLSRTGSQTLTDVLQTLGFRSHFVKYHDDLDDLLSRFDALTHLPLVEKFVDLDERFPNSRFILTVRDREDWLQSCEYRISLAAKHAAPESLAMLHRIYGSETFDRDLYSDAYDQYVARVKQYFSGRDQSLLILDLCGGEGFEKLCPFLGVDVPPEPFPYNKKNSRIELEKPLQKAKRFLIKHFQVKRVYLQLKRIYLQLRRVKLVGS